MMTAVQENRTAKIKAVLKKVVWNRWFLFLLVSLIFICLMYLVPYTNDDQYWLERGDLHSLAFYRDQVVTNYLSWSSRIIVNVMALFFLGHGKALFALFMGFCMYVFQYSLGRLIASEDDRHLAPAVAGFAMLIPFQYLGDAGWTITMCTYFVPAAFGLCGLVPAARIYRGEKFHAWEYPLYSLALIYGCNHEQEAVVIFFTYLVIFIAFSFTHRRTRYLTVQFLLALASVIFIFTCPGNYSRSGQEERWMPFYGMLNPITRVDLGFSAGVRRIIFNQDTYLVIICLLIAMMMWKKYKRVSYRLIGMYPLFCMVINTVQSVKTHLQSFDDNVGLVWLSGSAGFQIIPEYVRYLFYVLFVISLFLSFILLAGNGFEVLVCGSLFVAGLASTVMMGFSPTVYASGNRTMTAMVVALTASAAVCWSSGMHNGYLKREDTKTVNAAMLVMAVIMMVELYLRIMGQLSQL